MEVIREVALARYENLAETEKVKTQNHFNKFTASNGGDDISISDLLKFLEIQVSDEIIEVLELDMERRSDFDDFVTLKHMKETPCLATCDECSSVIRPGRCFFSCFECFVEDDSDDGYILCCHCYRSKMFIGHQHSEFYDNFSFQAKSKSKIIPKEVPGSDKDKRNEFFKRLTVNMVKELLVKAETIKRYGWEEYLDKFLDFDMEHKLREISLDLKKLEDKEVNATDNNPAAAEDVFDPIGPRPTFEDLHDN